MKLWWYSAANILYALGSIGYLVINIVNLIDLNTVESLVTYIILVLLAIVFVIDALLHTADCFQRREFIACLLNIIGSILYLIGATVFKNQKTSSNDFSNLSDIPAYVFNIVGMLAFLAESILTLFCTTSLEKIIEMFS
jgi:predicted membrane channel-forming protein YqfA (hemolysin III family)